MVSLSLLGLLSELLRFVFMFNQYSFGGKLQDVGLELRNCMDLDFVDISFLEDKGLRLVAQ